MWAFLCTRIYILIIVAPIKYRVWLLGYSEGGYAAFLGAQALQRLGVDIKSLHVGGTPMDLTSWLGYFAGTQEL